VQDGSKRRARLILILGILLATAAGVGTVLAAQGSQTAAPPVIETTPVLVAAREIPAKTTLTAADVKVQAYNVDAKPPAALVKPEDAIGKITLQAVGIGEPVTPTKFADPKNPAFVVVPASFLGTDGAPKSDSPNFRAMSITVPDANAVGGAVQPGDIVDVLYALQFDPAKFIKSPKPENNADFSVRIILERVTILAKTNSVYTIRTDAATAERIAYLQASGGQLSFLLRAPKDERAAGTAGVTFGAVQKEFKLPIPEKITP